MQSNLVSMKQFLIIFAFLFFITPAVISQQGDLLVKHSEKGLYIDHKVAAKESYYAIGRLYNLHPKNLASFNKLDFTKGLQIGQILKVPLSDTNFIQKGNTGAPVYYKVGANEGLMTVSRKHNDVNLASLRAWNNLSGDELKEGKKIIVGFLKGSGFPSVTLKSSPVEPVAKVEEKPEVVSTPEPVKETKTESKPEVKKVEPVIVKEEPKKVVAESGYFMPHYNQQVRITPVTRTETVTSGIFKTSSGWQDMKYYLLIDKVQPGTIVKIVNPANGSAVYAKVLGEMSGIRQNQGLGIRISNAAAVALDVKEADKFVVQISY